MRSSFPFVGFSRNLCPNNNAVARVRPTLASKLPELLDYTPSPEDPLLCGLALQWCQSPSSEKLRQGVRWQKDGFVHKVAACLMRVLRPRIFVYIQWPNWFVAHSRNPIIPPRQFSRIFPAIHRLANHFFQPSGLKLEIRTSARTKFPRAFEPLSTSCSFSLLFLR